MKQKTSGSNNTFKTSEQSRVLIGKRGDLLISQAAFPHIDHLVFGAKPGLEPRLHPAALKEYLCFLELVVLQERLIQVEPELDEETIANMHRHPRFFKTYTLAGDLNIEETTFKLLVDAGVIYIVTLETDLKPEEILNDHLAHSKKLQDELQFAEQHCREHYDGEISKADCNKLARAMITYKFGNLACIAEFARGNRIPFFLPEEEARWLQMSESLEEKTSRSVIHILKERLNAGARALLEQLEEYGGPVAFPTTPISAQILAESIAPEDLVDTALELRKEYSKFRSACSEIEKELTSERATLERRLKLIRELESMARELWPQKNHSSRMFATESTALVTLASAASADLTVEAGASLVAKVLSFPFESILRALRRRRIRLFIRAREKFLSAKDYAAKLASMFDLDETSVRNSLTKGFHITEGELRPLAKKMARLFKEKI